MIKTFLILFIFYLLPITVDGKTKCVKAVGKVQCRAEKAREADVEIYLMDKDSKGYSNIMKQFVGRKSPMNFSSFESRRYHGIYRERRRWVLQSRRMWIRPVEQS